MTEPQRPVAQEKVTALGARFLIVEARFYDDIGAFLLAGAEKVLQESGALYDIIRVPGALEIPQALSIALDGAIAANDPYQGAIVLGCIIRGETYHFEIVANESSRAVMDIAVARRLPLGNAILTVETETQALARARLEEGDKGGDAARAALAVFSLKKTIGKV